MILQQFEAVVTEEINGDYSLKLTMPRGFSEIENEQIIKVPTPKTDQLFRIYNSDVDMLGNPVFYARHIFYDLLGAWPRWPSRTLRLGERIKFFACEPSKQLNRG